MPAEFHNHIQVALESLLGHQISSPIGQPEGAVDSADVQLIAVTPAAGDGVIDGLDWD